MAKENIKVVTAEIEREGHYLITQRRETSILPLLWEFPGGRVEEGETEKEALRREIELRLGIDIEVGPLVMIVKKEYENYKIELYLYRCRILRGELRPLKVNDFRWVHYSELEGYEFPPADQETVSKIISEFEEG